MAQLEHKDESGSPKLVEYSPAGQLTQPTLPLEL
jgi:hypothetical protein